MTPDDEARAGERSETGSHPDDGDGEGGGGAALLERTVVAVSILLIASTLGFVLWQATVTSEVADPRVNVQSVEPVDGENHLRVGIELDNRRGPGLASVQVAVECGETERAVEFEHVPSGGRRTATVTCPGGSEPEAIVETWKDA
ncbi:hypothetical protein ACFQE8_14075 [Salinirubellus sp. GCM10025818]|uniref:hypothetical protein n=1 Tax=Salinirubellus TaxID=2162630 RepID=UPI0030D2BCB2